MLFQKSSSQNEVGNMLSVRQVSQNRTIKNNIDTYINMVNTTVLFIKYNIIHLLLHKSYYYKNIVLTKELKINKYIYL